MQPIQTNAIWITYASLLVAIVAHFGWIVSQDNALAIVASIAAIVSTVYQHYEIRTVNKIGAARGYFIK